MSRETLRQTLKGGDGTWWEVVSHKKGDRLYLKGLRKTCRYLGVDRLRKSPVLLPLEVFRKIGDFKAHVYATLFNGNDRPMSRQTINQITGISNRSQRNYEKKARVQTTQNWSRSRLPHRLSKEALGQGEYQRYEKGVWYLYKRLPDTRSTNYQVARRGMLRRLNRVLRCAVDEIVEYTKARARFSIGGKPATFRRYFNDPKTLLKAKNRLDVVFLCTGRYKDMVLWHPVYIE